MNLISNLIIPLLTLFIIIYGLYKKVDVYSSFIKGVNDALKLSLNIFPTIITMIIAINLLISSDVIDFCINKFFFLFNYLNIPSEIIPLALLRPVSSSASLIVMDNIIKKYGVDSFLGILSSIIQSSTDTTIYIIGLYFSSIGIKKIKYSLIVGLLADFFCVIIAIIVTKIYF